MVGTYKSLIGKQQYFVRTAVGLLVALLLAHLAACSGEVEEEAEDCPVGALGCTCYPNETCNNDEPLSCIDGLCQEAISGSHIAVVSNTPDARACDILLAASEPLKVQVEFAPHVRGDFVSRPPRTALALISEADRDLVGVLAEIVIDEQPGSNFHLEEFTCYDRLGHPLQDASVTIE